MDQQPDCTIIDCTLRDGGYYNNWDFHPDEGRRILGGLNQSGVSIAELGYRSRQVDDYYGLFKYCPEPILAELIPSPSDLEYSFMIDAKEFIGPDGLQNCDTLIPSADRSLFSWCRVAAYANEITATEPLLRHLKDQGYKIALNLMGISLLAKEDLARILEAVSRFPMDVFYFADSFGSLTPVDIIGLATQIRQFIASPLGFHAHANQGLEYINTLTALENGVTFIDSTLMGMGRGAGNLRTEQLLLGLFGKGQGSRYNPYVLLDALEYTMKPLHQKYRWGWDFEYMLSGIKDIHPTYCQELKSSHLFTVKQVSEILHTIPEQKRLKFSADELSRAIEKTINRSEDGLAEEACPLYSDFTPSDCVLIVARGPQARKHKQALARWICQENPLVLECNDTGFLDEIRRLTVILNRVRFREAFDRITDPPRTIIYGGKGRIPSGDAVYHFPVGIEKETRKAPPTERPTIPYYNVAAYALVLASRFSPKRLFIAGFDGDRTDTEAALNEKRITQELFDSFLPLILPNVEFGSLTQTDYRVPVRSVYALLRSDP